VSCPHALQEKLNFSSAIGFPECPSAALREVLHSGNGGFPECLEGHDTQGRWAHLKEKLHLTVTLDGAVRQKIEKSLPDCHALALGEGDLFPESHVPTPGQVTNSLSAPSLALGEGPLPRVLEHVTRGTVFYFLVFLPHFFL
jgi:hypothetical protein